MRCISSVVNPIIVTALLLTSTILLLAKNIYQINKSCFDAQNANSSGYIGGNFRSNSLNFV